MSNSTYFNVVLNSFTPTIINNQVVFNARVKFDDLSSTSNKLKFLEDLGVVDITTPFSGPNTCWSNISFKLLGEYSLKFKISIAGMEFLEDCSIDMISVKRSYDKKNDAIKYTYNINFLAREVPKEVVEKYCEMIKYKETDPETMKEAYKPLDMEIVPLVNVGKA